MALFLHPVVGWLTAPGRRRRGPWVFEPLDPERPTERIRTSSIGSGLLDDFESPGHVVGLYWVGSLVAVRLPHGRVVETQRHENRRWGRRRRSHAG
jgi:hypothetical protein